MEGRWNDRGAKEGILFTIVITLFAIFRVFNKNACRAMRAVRGYITYDRLEEYLEKEEFKKIDGCIIKMEVSEYWIKLEGGKNIDMFIKQWDKDFDFSELTRYKDRVIR